MTTTNSPDVRSKKESRLLQLCLLALVIYLACSVVVGVVVADSALHPARRLLTAADEEEGQAWARNNDDATVADVTISANDGISLQAWEIRPDEFNGDEVILLHGLRGNRLEMVNYADMFLNRGYGVLMPDARAHGASGGEMATYGSLERNDIHLWFQWLVTHRHPRCIYGFGESMGAAQLLQSLQLEQRFCAVAAECPFSTLRETFYDRIGQRFRIGPWLGRTIFRPIVESSYVYLRLRYALDLDEISPEDAVAHTRVPVLLIHGLSDSNIPVRHSERIAARNQSVVLWEIPNTGHSNAIDTSAHELEKRLTSWFGSHQTRGPSRNDKTVLH